MAKVLLVDDDCDFREALEEALRAQGFDVTVAGDAESACGVVAQGVAAYGAEHPDLSLVCTGPWAPANFSEAAA